MPRVRDLESIIPGLIPSSAPDFLSLTKEVLEPLYAPVSHLEQRNTCIPFPLWTPVGEEHHSMSLKCSNTCL